MRNYNDSGIIDQSTVIQLLLSSLLCPCDSGSKHGPLLPLARISYNSRGETRQLRVRGAARFILLRSHVKLLVKRPRQLFILLLLLTTRARALLFPALPLACRALVFSLISAFASPSPRVASTGRHRRRGGGRGMRRHRLRVCIGAGELRVRSAWWQREGSLVAPK